MKTRKLQKLFTLLFTFLILTGEVLSAVPAYAAVSYCTYCGGTGDCNSCYGIGDCDECYGYGGNDCDRCIFGDCVECAGEGSIPYYSMGDIKERKCSYCSGSGKCNRCKGSGEIKCSRCSGSGDCRTCGGAANCKSCGGSGYGNDDFVNPVPPNPQYLNIDRTSLTLKVGESYTFTVTGKTNDNKASAKYDESYLRESTDGSFTYTALKAGVTTIEFCSTDNTVKVVCNVTIQAPAPVPSPNTQYLEIDCSTLTLNVGESYTFSVSGKTNDGKAYADYDESYLRESTDGSFTYTALKAGTTTIEFRSTDDTVKAVCNVTIMDNTKNTLRVTIDDEEQVFYLERASVSVTDIYVYYTALNPRGEERYKIEFNFDKNLTAGTYSIMDRDAASDAAVDFKEAGSYTWYRSQRTGGRGKNATGSFTINSVNDDWTTYEGSFTVTLAPYHGSDSITIEDAEFNFTIGETHEKLA